MAKATTRRELTREEVGMVLATWTLQGAQAALQEWWGLVEGPGVAYPSVQDLLKLEAAWEP